MVGVQHIAHCTAICVVSERMTSQRGGTGISFGKVWGCTDTPTELSVFDGVVPIPPTELSVLDGVVPYPYRTFGIGRGRTVPLPNFRYSTGSYRTPTELSVFDGVVPIPPTELSVFFLRIPKFSVGYGGLYRAYGYFR